MEENKDRDEIYSNRVRAGKRTYFFDVKATKTNDYYLTITESKKKVEGDNYQYEKHKIFLYKEDMEAFAMALNESIDFMKNELLTDVDFSSIQRDSHKPNDEEDTDNELVWD